MTTRSTNARTTRPDRFRGLAQLLIAALAVAILVLAILVFNALKGGPTVTADAGEKLALQLEPYGRELTILTPGSEVTFVVGAPVRTIDYALLDVDYDDPRWEERQDLGAPDDGSLVPITWSTRAIGGFTREDDLNPIELRLVVDGEPIELASVVLDGSGATMDAYEPRSVAIAVDGDPKEVELEVEVEYDGVTQSADVASGEVDAGVAQTLYDGNRDFATGCAEVEDQCPLRAADPKSAWRPESATFIASHVTLYPYDATLGWADEGTLWAGVRLHLFGASGVGNAAGDYRVVAGGSAPQVSLDGAEPVRREGLGNSTFDTVGRVVFRVDHDAEPRELTIEQLLAVRGPGSPGDVAARADLELTPIG